MNDIMQKAADTIANGNAAMREANEVIRAAGEELRAVDAVLARRTALDDQPTRVLKIKKAIWVAARADELAKALQLCVEDGFEGPNADYVAAAAHLALNNYRRPFQ